MVRIIVLSVLGTLLAACSGSSRVEDILRANTPPHSTTQYSARKNQLDNRSTPAEVETRIKPEAEPPEPPKAVVRSLSEE
jgi:hypothetical protein